MLTLSNTNASIGMHKLLQLEAGGKKKGNAGSSGYSEKRGETLEAVVTATQK